MLICRLILCCVFISKVILVIRSRCLGIRVVVLSIDEVLSYEFLYIFVCYWMEFIKEIVLLKFELINLGYY